MAGVSSRYRIVRRLGQGGMAEVFEGELVGEHGFVRRVAVKQLLAGALHDPVAARRFVDESRIASQLHHANIVAVLDVGVLDDRPFQVLELVDGLDAHALAQRAGGRLPVDIALMLAHAVAHALDHAHMASDAAGRSLGIVHRDVKPPNILVAWNGDVKLADFGIAVAHDRVAHTETGSVAGTRGFIAPEQRTRAQLDGRSDVFALGLTLHALCTGATPLADIVAEARLLGGEPLVLDPSLPDDLRALIAPAVAPDRRDRPTAATLASAIGAALAARGARDPRGALRDFVSGFRTPPRRPGALDLLLGVELVPLDEPAGTVQRYATVIDPMAATTIHPAGAAEPRGVVDEPDATRHGGAGASARRGAEASSLVAPPADAAPSPSVAARDSAVVAEPPTVVSPARAGAPRRRVGWLVVAAGALTIVAVVGLVTRRMAPADRAPVALDTRDRSEQVAATAAIDAGSSPVLAAASAVDAGSTRVLAAAPIDAGASSPEIAAASAVGAGSPRVLAAAAIDAGASSPELAGVAPIDAGAPLRVVAAAPGARRAEPPSVASRRPPEPAATPAVRATPPVAAPVGHGYVQVIGEELLRARVLIDGVAVGYVPNRFEVALGHHRVEVERPDGVRLPPRELDVTSFHTAKNPARPTW